MTPTFRSSRPTERSFVPRPPLKPHIRHQMTGGFDRPRSPLTLACNVAVVAMFVVVAGLCAKFGWAW